MHTEMHTKKINRLCRKGYKAHCIGFESLRACQNESPATAMVAGLFSYSPNGLTHNLECALHNLLCVSHTLVCKK